VIKKKKKGMTNLFETSIYQLHLNYVMYIAYKLININHTNNNNLCLN